MLHVPAAEPPKSGRSRFSKALPAVPDLTKSAVLPPPPEHLPSLPSLPKTPASLHSNSPLPPVPFSPASSSPSTSSSLPRAMSIPRKPVGKLLASAPPPEPAEPHSPTDSIASILSAYSRSSGESLVRLSDGSASMRESNVTTSPTSDAPTLPATMIQSTGPRPAQSLARKAVGGGLPPSPPTKDERFQPLVSPIPAQASSPDIGAPSSSQPQIWLRRSRSSSRGMTDLKLPYSHGSTAATQSSGQIAHTQASTETLKAAPRNPQPPSGAKGLPGRNIRPSASADPNPSDTEKKPDTVAPTEKVLPPLVPSVTVTTSANQGLPSRPKLNRPPTPEYQKEDVKSPVVSTYVSPVSPASSPEPSGRLAETLKPSPQTPQGPSFQSAAAVNNVNKPFQEKSLPATNLDLHSVRSVPNLRNQTPPPANEPLPRDASGGDLTMNRGRIMNEMPPDRFRNSGDSMGSRARSSSARPGQRRPMEQPRTLAPELDPRLVYSEGQGYLYRGRDGTLYPEMKDLREPDTRAFRFPTQAQHILPADTICQAAPLKPSHYDCFQNHRSMNRRSNRNCPLTCQTCERSDSDDRWSCTFCHLRMCEACFRTFNDNQRDLRRLTDALTRENVVDLSSLSGLGSALGIITP